MTKTIMILGASILQLPAIEQAKQMGLKVVAVDMDPDAVGFSVPGIKKEVISTIDIPAVMEAAKRHKIDGIMTLASDMPMRTVAAVAKEMGLVGITEDTALKATNKAAMRQALKEHNVPIPAFFKVSSEQEYRDAVSCFSGAFMVKPADNSGSRGIVKVEDPNDEAAATAAYTYSLQSSRNGDVVVEEHMQGPEVSVETLSVDGVCHVIQITDKLTTGAPHFVEMGHTQPTALDEMTVQRIKQVTIAANHAVGITNGPSHTEIIVTEDGPKIVELGARLGGDCITTHLVPLSTGVNMVENCIRIALGEQPNLQQTLHKASAIRYFQQKAGKVKAIDGIDEAKKITGVKQVSIVHGEGECIHEITSSGARMGFVIAHADNAEKAAQAAEKALQTIKITME